MSTPGEAVGPMPGGPPGMPVFNPNPSKGLQPLIITLLYLCPGIAGLIVLVRIIKKRIDRTLGGGKFLSILPEDSVLTTLTDDALIVLGWLLCLGNSVIVHFCKCDILQSTMFETGVNGNQTHSRYIPDITMKTSTRWRSTGFAP